MPKDTIRRITLRQIDYHKAIRPKPCIIEGIIEGSYLVYLKQRTYDCGRFHAFHFTCAHAIAACASTYMDYMKYVDEVYKRKRIYKVYKFEFSPIPNEGRWSPISSALFKFLLTIKLCRKLN